MIVKPKSLYCVDIELNNVNSNNDNFVAINCNLLICLFFLKIVKIEFKMTFQIVFCLEFLQLFGKHDFLYLSFHLSKWNESKLPMFIKIYSIRCYFLFFWKNDLRKFLALPLLA